MVVIAMVMVDDDDYVDDVSMGKCSKEAIRRITNGASTQGPRLNPGASPQPRGAASAGYGVRGGIGRPAGHEGPPHVCGLCPWFLT